MYQATRYRWRWAALAALLTAEAMNLLDTTITQVAAPVIHRSLPGPVADIQWFSAAYTLPFALLLITGGRIGDIAGRRRTFRVGVTAFVVASACCALATSAALLITCRAVQGAAAALVIPQTFGLIKAMFDGPELGRALGTIGPVMGLAAISGPILGGVLTHALTWRSVFLVNVPLGIAVLAMAPLLREDRAAHRPRLDVTGTLLAVAGLGLLIYPLIENHAYALMVAGAAILVGFAAHQRRSPSPLVELSLFRNRGFPATLVTSLLFFTVMTGAMLVIVLNVELTGHADARGAGLTLIPWSAGMALASVVAGAHLVERFGPRLMYAGLVLLAAGLLGYAAWPSPVTLALSGLGLGTFTVPFFTTALHRVRPAETGSAAGLLNAVQQLGGTVGVAVLGTVFFHAGAHRALWLAAAILAAAAVTVAAMTHDGAHDHDGGGPTGRP